MNLNNPHLSFEPSEHKYVFTPSPSQCVSVTQFVSAHFPSFDNNGYGTSEACTREIKKWSRKMPLDAKHFPKCSKLFGDEWVNEVKKRKGRKTKKVTSEEVLEWWEKKGQLARDHGTRVHELLEQCILRSEPPSSNAPDEVKRGWEYFVETYSPTKASPEVRVVAAQGDNLIFPLAGTIDLVIQNEDGTITLLDWKTNTDIYKPAYNNKRGTSELTEDLEASALNKYTLQLSTYAYILEECYGLTIRELILGWVTEDFCEPIQVSYEKERVEDMIHEFFNSD